jgi:hypothetical protein
MTCGVELFGQVWIRGTPGEEDFVPFTMDRGALVFQVGEVGLHLIADIEMGAFWKAEAFLG